MSPARRAGPGLVVLVLAVVLASSCEAPGAGGEAGGSRDARGVQATQTTGGAAESMAGMGHGSGSAGSGMAVGDGRYSDRRFIDAMVPHHQGAVDMAKVALKNAERPELRRLAETMISSQRAEIAELELVKKAEFGTSEVPARVSSEEMRSMGMMKDASKLADRRPFDRAFIDAMVPHHRAAIEMAEAALKESDYPGVQDTAQSIVEAQRREIEQMERWRREWYPKG
jgi:uncharacterized protein (DUF305 family)